MHSINLHNPGPSHQSQPNAELERQVQAVVTRLVGSATIAGKHHKVLAPLEGVWEDFQELERMKGRLSNNELIQQAKVIKDQIINSAHSSPDIRLMCNVIDAVMTPGGLTLQAFLTQTVFNGLCLYGLGTLEQMCEPWEAEPNFRTFNSTLPLVAGLIYEHSPMGRTLLWRGACGLFPGVSQAKRQERLKMLIFEFPNDRENSEDRLTQTDHFCAVVDAMNLDEEGDVRELERQFKKYKGR